MTPSQTPTLHNNVQVVLPTLADLHHDVQSAFKNDQLNTLLNQPPHQSWIKKHPMTKGEYLPIDKVEFMLTRIFQHWRIEILRFDALFQSVVVHVRLHYKNPVTGEWQYHDGVGACPVQTDAGQSAANLGAIKNAAVQMALPAAESYAIKDAAEKLGMLFGKDLNRKDTILFSGAYGEAPQQPQAATPPPAPVWDANNGVWITTEVKPYTQADIHKANSAYVAPVQNGNTLFNPSNL